MTLVYMKYPGYVVTMQSEVVALAGSYVCFELQKAASNLF